MTTSAGSVLNLVNTPPSQVQVVVSQPAGILLEGTPIVLNGSFVDPGAAETHSFQWQVASTSGQSIANQSGTVPAGEQVPAFNFTPTGNGTFTARLTIDDGQQSSSGFRLLTVGNVLPQNLTLTASPSDVPVGTPISVSGAFVDPGSDPWQVTLIVRQTGAAQPLLRLPIAPSGTSIAASSVVAQVSQLEVNYEVFDGTGLVASQPITVSVGQPLHGDINGDGRISLLDLGLLQRAIGTTSGATQGDWNGDGAVNRADAVIFALNYGRIAPAPSPAAAPAAEVAHASQLDSVFADPRASGGLTASGARRPTWRSGHLPAVDVDRAIRELSVELLETRTPLRAGRTRRMAR